MCKHRFVEDVYESGGHLFYSYKCELCGHVATQEEEENDIAEFEQLDRELLVNNHGDDNLPW
jgi:hypothetical protein